MPAPFIISYLKLFRYYKQLGDLSISQVTDDAQLFWSPGAESNSMAVMVQHLNGNMLSRWTDFLTTDGEKEWRNRDKEFELYIETREELLQLWEQGWACLFSALESIHEDDQDKLVYIRMKGHSIEEAIQRQLAHYAYHVGQMVYLARMMVGTQWASLSIPKGGSNTYNEKAVSPGARKEHFTDVLMEDKD